MMYKCSRVFLVADQNAKRCCLPVMCSLIYTVFVLALGCADTTFRFIECDERGIGCLPDEICSDAQCVLKTRCESDRDCELAAERCVTNIGACVVREGFDTVCLSDGDCELNESCILGDCISLDDTLECSGPGSCPFNSRCSPVHFQCIPEASCLLSEDYPELACWGDEECDEALERCILPCQNECTFLNEAEDCGPLQVCDASCRCVECRDNQDCGQGLTCNTRRGECVASRLCFADIDCDEGFECDTRLGLCRLPPSLCTNNDQCDLGEFCNASGLCESIESSCLPDRFEESDTLDSATTIPFEANMSIAHENLTLCTNDPDLFKIALSPGQSFRVTVSPDALDPNSTLKDWSGALRLLREIDGRLLAQELLPPLGLGRLEYQADTNDTIGIQLSLAEGQAAYGIGIEFFETPLCENTATIVRSAPANESVSITLENAPLLERSELGLTHELQLCGLDVDTFRVDLADAERLLIRSTGQSSGLDTDIEVYELAPLEADGTFNLSQAPRLITSSQERSFRESAFVTSRTSNHLFVRIASRSMNGGTYALNLDVSEDLSCSPDGDEPNDSLANARVLALTTAETITNSLCADDQDLYTFFLEAFERINIEIRFERLNLSPNIMLMNDRQEEVGAFAFEYDELDAYGMLRFQPTTRGNYSLYLSNNTEYGANYEAALDKSIASPCSDDEFEPNDRIEDAIEYIADVDGELHANLCAFDRDNFKLEMNRGDIAEIVARFFHSEGDLDMRLIHPDGVSVIERAQSSTNNEGLVVEAPVDGLYTLELYATTPNEPLPYTLEITSAGR